MGRSVPDNLRVATRYDGLRAKLATPALTAVNLHLDQIAEIAVDLLIAKLHSRTAQPPTYLAPELVPRASSTWDAQKATLGQRLPRRRPWQ
jgi:DNA-binding LacI/PurR family transcriptional regulator